MSRRGIYISEQATSITPPVTANAAMPVYVGTAPAHRAADPAAAVNRVIIAYSYAEAVNALGYSDDWEKYTLCEAMYTQFRLYNVAPVVFINVADPTKLLSGLIEQTLLISDNKAEINDELASPATLKVMATPSGTELIEGDDYTIGLIDGGIAIYPIKGGAIDAASDLAVEYKQVDSTTTSADVKGGVDPSTDQRTGIELIDEVFMRTRLVPGILAAPGWEDDAEIAYLLDAKARRLNIFFKCIAVVDVPISAGTSYKDIPLWKEQHGISSEYCITCWPLATLGDRTFHLSAHIAGVLGRTDAAQGDVPYFSPSNQPLSIDGAIWNGKEVMLDTEQATYIENNGIVTPLNFIGGWRAWGDHTSCYPGNADPKDRFIPIRRMFNWINNTIVLTHWGKISYPIQRVLVDNIKTSVNLWLDGLASQGFILGGRFEFLPEDNLKTSFADGKLVFRLYVTPPPPFREGEFIMEYDTNYMSVLFA